MKPRKKIVRVFFSWQSTLDKKHNTDFIRYALKKAKTRIESSQHEIEILLDEATRNVPGSPDIATTIQSKIALSQIVISDITIIQGLDTKKSYPNPNVMFELGYAVSELGWNRIIALSNDLYNFKPEDLPFDINKQRVSPYNSENGKDKLIELLCIAITTILEHNPKTPQELRGVTPEKIKHEKDLENISLLMSYIHTHTIENFLEQLPNIFIYEAGICWASFHAYMNANSFHIYDESIATLLKSLYNNWSNILEIGLPYYENVNGSIHQTFKKRRRYDHLNGTEANNAWNVIGKLAMDMQITFKRLLENIHNNYIEININETNAKAWNDIRKNRP
ncbi:hypothetical protein [Kosakonia cowanii]|jgi:hypothetical protein